jgi:hypothetical protein
MIQSFFELTCSAAWPRRSPVTTSADSPCTTLGRLLGSPGFAGCHVPVDPGHRKARQRRLVGGSANQLG